MSNLQTKLPTDQWVTATWEEYTQAMANPAWEKAKGYYYKGQLRIETMGSGSGPARDRAIIILAASLFCIAKAIAAIALNKCSYTKPGESEFQPDASYYLGDRAQLAPHGRSTIDLDRYPPPDLAIEVASSSLSDELGSKQLLYEEMGISEYWVLDVQNIRVIAFAVRDRGSERITESRVLPGLAISVLEEALQRSRQTDQTQVGAWLLTQFQAS